MKGIGWQEVCSADAFCISEMETKDIMTSNAEKCNAICLKKEISTRLPPEGIFETQSEWLLMAHDTPGICLGAIPSQCPLVELGTEFLCLVIVWTLSVPFKGWWEGRYLAPCLSPGQGLRLYFFRALGLG
jgi:hypothetical protein